MRDLTDRYLAGLNNNAAMARIGAAADRQDASLDKSSKTAAMKIINDFRNDPITKIAQKLVPDALVIQRYRKEGMKSLHGMNTVDLIFMAARAFDPQSTVRDGERATIEANSDAWASRLGVSLKRIMNKPDSLSPEGKQRIIEVIAPRIADNLKMYRDARNASLNMIKEFKPEYANDLYLPNYLNTGKK